MKELIVTKTEFFNKENIKIVGTAGSGKTREIIDILNNDEDIKDVLILDVDMSKDGWINQCKDKNINNLYFIDSYIDIESIIEKFKQNKQNKKYVIIDNYNLNKNLSMLVEKELKGVANVFITTTNTKV